MAEKDKKHVKKYYPNGPLLLEGDVVDGKKEGKWTSYGS